MYSISLMLITGSVALIWTFFFVWASELLLSWFVGKLSSKPTHSAYTAHHSKVQCSAVHTQHSKVQCSAVNYSLHSDEPDDEILMPCCMPNELLSVSSCCNFLCEHSQCRCCSRDAPACHVIHTSYNTPHTHTHTIVVQ